MTFPVGDGVESGPSRRRRRPVPVELAAVLALAVGAYQLFHGVSAMLENESSSRFAEGAVDAALGILALAIAVAIFRVRHWAWVAFMTWALVGLAHQLLRHFFYDDPDYFSMALDTVVVFALTPLDVQLAFGIRPQPLVLVEHEERDSGELG
jgi:hypothetical protein